MARINEDAPLDAVNPVAQALAYNFNANDPNINAKLRERIALQMMASKKGYPKNVGEGLTSIGDAIGDLGQMNRLEAIDRAATERAMRAEAGGTGAAVPPVTRSELAPPQQTASLQTGVQAPPPAAAGAAAPPGNLPPSLATPTPTPAAPAQTGAMPPPPAAGSIPGVTPSETGYRPPAGLPIPGVGGEPRLNSPTGAPDWAIQLPRTPGGFGDPRTRAAYQLAMQAARARGGPPPNPTQAGDQTPAVQQPTSSGPATDAGQSDPRLNAFAQAPTGVISDARRAPADPRGAIQRAPQADPGYVPDLGPEPEVPRRVPLKPIQQYAIDQVRADPHNDLLKERMKALYDRGEQERSFEESRAIEIYKDKMIQRRALELKREEMLGTQAQRRQTYEIGARPKLEEDVEDKTYWNAERGRYERPPMAPDMMDPSAPPKFKGTEFEKKSLINYGRARLAHEGLVAQGKGELELADSPWQSLLGTNIPVLGAPGRALQSDAYKKADIDRENFVQAFIRQQSGGAYTDTELEKEARALLPKYNDPPDILEQKRLQREKFLQGMFSAVGPGGQRVIKWQDAQDRAAAAAKAAAGGAKPPAATEGGGPVRIRNDDDYNALKSGDAFIDPEGNPRVKP